MKRKEKVIKQEEIFELNTDEVELHPLAETTPLMTDSNYTALLNDIDANGQLEPVVLFRGRIVDGRHRQMVLQELGVKTIKAIKLPHNTSAATLKSLVRSREIRRHETPTQLAISAYRLMLNTTDKKLSQREAAEIVGSIAKNVSYAKSIAERYNRPDILEELFNGGTIDIGDGHIPYPTDSLYTILNWLKETKSKTPKNNGKGDIQMTEEQFAECAVLSKEITGKDIKMVEHIARTLYVFVADYKTDLADKEKAKEEHTTYVSTLAPSADDNEPYGELTEEQKSKVAKDLLEA